MATKTPLSLAQFLALPEHPQGLRMELDQGEVIVSPPPKFRHTVVVADVYDSLRDFVRAHPLGRILPSEAGYILKGESFRCPDVSFVRTERLQTVDADGWITGAPDLAIEVISPSQTATEMQRKIRQFLDDGATAVWLIDPEEKTAAVYTNDGRFMTLGTEGVLTCPELLPGFSLPLAELFR